MRRVQEALRRAELGAVVSQCSAVRKKIADYRAVRKERLIHASRDGSLQNIESWKSNENYALLLLQKAQHLSKELEALEEKRQEKMVIYREAQKKCDVLQRLHDRKLHAHKMLMKRREYAEITAMARQSSHNARRQYGGTV